jgi:predicted phosphodiesterase
MPRVWTPEKVEILKEYVKAGLSVQTISKKLKTTYDATKHAIRRFGLDKYTSEDDLCLEEITGKKIKKREVNALARMIGEKILSEYQAIPLKAPAPAKCEGLREEYSILDISDVHIGMINESFDEAVGKKIITYNMDIFYKELQKLQNSIGEIHGILSSAYKLKKLYINVIGDIVTNDRIFPEQTFEVEKCVGLQMWDAIHSFNLFFNNLLNFYEEIEVNCVVGNHGRSNPTHYNEPVENNFEYFVYRTWQEQFKNNPRIKVVVPDTTRYIYSVGPWRHLIEHGHNLRGYTDNAIKSQMKEMHINVSGFDVMHFGHIHELADKSISDKVIVKQNGCWIYKDEYAWQKFKTYSIPKQHFFGCNKKRPETWNYKLDLRIGA